MYFNYVDFMSRSWVQKPIWRMYQIKAAYAVATTNLKCCVGITITFMLWL